MFATSLGEVESFVSISRVMVLILMVFEKLLRSSPLGGVWPAGRLDFLLWVFFLLIYFELCLFGVVLIYHPRGRVVGSE